MFYCLKPESNGEAAAPLGPEKCGFNRASFQDVWVFHFIKEKPLQNQTQKTGLLAGLTGTIQWMKVFSVLEMNCPTVDRVRPSTLINGRKRSSGDTNRFLFFVHLRLTLHFCFTVFAYIWLVLKEKKNTICFAILCGESTVNSVKQLVLQCLKRTPFSFLDWNLLLYWAFKLLK